MGLLATTFRLASRLRRARAFHPRGASWTASWEPAGRSVPPGRLSSATHPAVLRLSHGIGFPATAPDVLGIAVKVLDAHGVGHDQDLLFASTGSGRVTRHLLRPSRRLGGVTHSTLLPYEVGGHGRHPLVAVPVASADLTYAEVLGGRRPPPPIEIRLAVPDGPLVAVVTPERLLPPDAGEAVRFDPWHTGPELRPVGWLNRIRRPTYAASQSGRGAPPDGTPAARGVAVSASGRRTR